jgi:hypothetical protein
VDDGNGEPDRDFWTIFGEETAFFIAWAVRNFSTSWGLSRRTLIASSYLNRKIISTAFMK